MASSFRSSMYRGRDEYTGFYLLVIIAGLALLLWASWHTYHAEISRVVMQAAHWQMKFIHQFTDRFDRADSQVLAANPNRVTFEQLVRQRRVFSDALAPFYGERRGRGRERKHQGRRNPHDPRRL